MYKKDSESFTKKDQAMFEKWLKEHDVRKFIIAARQAEMSQDYLDALQEDFIQTQRLFPLNKPRHDH